MGSYIRNRAIQAVARAPRSVLAILLTGRGSIAAPPRSEHSRPMFYTNRDLTLRIRIALAALASVASTAAIIMALLAARQANQQAAATQTRLVEVALDRQVQGLAAEQRMVSHWDEAVIHSARADRGWLDDHIGTRMQEAFGHDRAYILVRSDLTFLIPRNI